MELQGQQGLLVAQESQAQRVQQGLPVQLELLVLPDLRDLPGQMELQEQQALLVVRVSQAQLVQQELKAYKG